MSEGENSPRRRRVLIVGGGLAGLAAAEALARHDRQRFEVTLLEAKRNLGGRAGSFFDRRSGETIDYCQHVAMGCCTNLLGLLKRCGLEDSWQRYSQLEFRHPRFPPSRFAAVRWLPPPLHLSGAIGGLRFLSGAQKRSICLAMFRLMRTPPESLTELTAGAWLRRQGQTADTIGKFWDVVLVSALGEQTNVVSMAAARQVFIDGFAAARGASDVLVPKQPLAELFGQSLRQAIADLGVQIETGTKVTQLHQLPEAMAADTSSGDRRLADHVIAAVPWFAIDPLTAPLDRWTSRPKLTLRSSAITGMHLWFDREITSRPHTVLVDTTAQWLFRSPCHARSDQSGHYYQVVISASAQQRRMPTERLIDTVLGELHHAFPDAANAQLLHHRIVTDPNSVFSVSPETEQDRPTARTPLPCFHLAGDWIATGWPATMEGAVISGRMAAGSVLQSEGLEGVSIDSGLRRGWLAKRLIR